MSSQGQCSNNLLSSSLLFIYLFIFKSPLRCSQQPSNMLLIHHMKKKDIKPHFLCQATIPYFCFPLRKNLKELSILCLYFPSFHSRPCQSDFLIHQSTKTTLSKLCFAKSNCQPPPLTRSLSCIPLI